MSILHNVEKLCLSGSRKLLLLNNSSKSNARALHRTSIAWCEDADSRRAHVHEHRHRDLKEYTIDEMPVNDRIKKARDFVEVMDGMRRTGSKRIVKEISVDESLLYMESEAYKLTYGNEPVWVPFRRNHKGGMAPRSTRVACILQGIINTGSACPLCRDDYLVVHPRNLRLLRQFISPHTGEIMPAFQTNVCQRGHLSMKIAIDKAQERGTLPYDVTLRNYDYSLYYPNWGKRGDDSEQKTE